MSFVEVMRTIGSQWGEMTDIDKRPYEDKARSDKLRFKEELEAFSRNKTHQIPEKHANFTGVLTPR